ncbi:hypothetical protein PBRA_001067, partial [Plasmodiophora brassicae]
LGARVVKMSAWIVVAIVVLHVTVLGAPAAHRDQNSTSVPRCVAQCDDDNSHAAILGDILDEVSYCDGGFSTGPLRPHVDWVSAKCIRWRRNDDGKRVLVGQGSFGKVYLARFGADDVAVKKFKEQHSCRHELEASIACKDIPGIIPFLGITPLDDRQYGLVTLLAKHGTLRHIIHSSDVSSECLLQLMIDVCSGVAALHSLGIVHGDLTPTNIFVRDSLSGPKALIGDLGTAVCLKRHQPIPDRCFFQTCTVNYAAPEQLAAGAKHPYGIGSVCWGAPADIWSLAVILIETLTRKMWLPFHRDHDPRRYYRHIVRDGKRPVPPAHAMSAPLQHTVARCLDIDPLSRPTAACLQATLQFELKYRAAT